MTREDKAQDLMLIVNTSTSSLATDELKEFVEKLINLFGVFPKTGDMDLVTDMINPESLGRFEDIDRKKELMKAMIGPLTDMLDFSNDNSEEANELKRKIKQVNENEESEVVKANRVIGAMVHINKLSALLDE